MATKTEKYVASAKSVAEIAADTELEFMDELPNVSRNVSPLMHLINEFIDSGQPVALLKGASDSDHKGRAFKVRAAVTNLLQTRELEDRVSVTQRGWRLFLVRTDG